MKHKKTFILVVFIAVLLTASGFQTSPEYKILFEKAKFTMETKGDLNGAINLFNDIIKKYPKEREYAAKSQLYIGFCYEKLGAKEARKAYERVVREYADQPEPTKVARERLSALTAGGGGATGRTEVAMRRVWVGKDWVAGISPDGRYAVHILPGASRGYDYWLRDLQSGEQKQINREALSNVAYPALISPDGKWIAYACAIGKCGELRVSALDGSSMRVLIPCETMASTAIVPRAWMPDSRQLLAISFGVKDGGFWSYQRHIISVPDGTVREMGQPVRDPGLPTGGFQYVGFGIYPAPDGRYIAYSLKRDIYIYDTTTEQDSVLVQSPAADYLTGWTPDGSAIVFLSDRSGTNDLYLLGIENGRPRGDPQLLRRDFGANTNLFLTRDGRLFRIENTPTRNSFIVPVDEQTGKLTGSPSPVDANYPNVLWPKWSRDGRLLYYQIYKEPADDRSRLLLIRSEATGETREVTPKPQLSYWSDPTLSPDGRGFMVPGVGQNMNWGLFAVDSESGNMTQFLKIPNWWLNIDWDPCPNWSPDGKAIFYKIPPRELDEKKPNLTEFVRASKDFIIVRKELATGEEKDVHHGIPTADMQISPDGTRFVYYRRDMAEKSNVLGILDLQSDKELELWRVPLADSPGIGSPTWTPDGRHVLVGKDLKQGTELWRFPAAGGPGERLHSFPESTWRFVMHPSGKRMAFTQSLSNFELWVLENFLPPSKSLTVATPAPATPIPVQARPRSGSKVLMIVNEGKFADLELMLTREVGVMKSLLEKAGFEVVVATVSNQPLVAGGVTLKPDVKLSDVHLADYKGVIVPCMAVNSKPLPPEGLAIIREAVAKGKPLAAQTGSVLLLGRAGLLAGRKYAGRPSWVANNPELKDAVYSGDGVVQDGRLITSGTCPYTAKQQGLLDGTSRLTEALIAELRR